MRTEKGEYVCFMSVTWKKMMNKGLDLDFWFFTDYSSKGILKYILYFSSTSSKFNIAEIWPKYLFSGSYSCALY
jgi:hypothetical protein